MTTSRSGPRAGSATVSVVTGEAARVCRPFLMEFRLTAPEAGFRIFVLVEKACTADAEPLLKLVFDLFRKVDGEFVEIVHVSFRAESPVEKAGIEVIAAEGLPPKSARVLRQEVFPVAKELEGRAPTTDDRLALRSGMSKAAVVAVEL